MPKTLTPEENEVQCLIGFRIVRYEYEPESDGSPNVEYRFCLIDQADDDYLRTATDNEITMWEHMVRIQTTLRASQQENERLKRFESADLANSRHLIAELASLRSDKQKLEKELRDQMARNSTMELEVNRLGGCANAKYYHEDYVDDLRTELEAEKKGVRENHIIYFEKEIMCIHCREVHKNEIRHKPNCIVLKSVK